MIKVLGLVFVAASVAACSTPGVAISNRAMDAHESAAYNEYLNNQAEIDLECEKPGLAPAPILTRDPWAGKK